MVVQVEPETSRARVERVKALYDRVAADYDHSYLDPVSAAENAVVFRTLTGMLPIGRTVDFGCGTGLFLSWMMPPPDLYVGIDVSAGMLAQARRKYPEYEFRQAGLEGLAAVPYGSIDTVVALFGVLSYLPDPGRFFGLAYRALRPGGRILAMAYGPPHAGCKVLAAAGLPDPRRRLTSGELGGLACAYAFDAEELYGLRGPTRYLPDRLAARLIPFEARTLGALWPDLGAFLVLRARRL